MDSLFSFVILPSPFRSWFVSAHCHVCTSADGQPLAAYPVFFTLKLLPDMKIYVNSNPLDTEATTLAELIGQLQLPPNGIAVALGGNMVKRPDWENTPLQEDDRVLIIKASCGG